MQGAQTWKEYELTQFLQLIYSNRCNLHSSVCQNLVKYIQKKLITKQNIYQIYNRQLNQQYEKLNQILSISLLNLVQVLISSYSSPVSVSVSVSKSILKTIKLNMKKFKKALTISINQQQNPSNIQSPKQKLYNSSKRHLLMYNEHTIASSVNNQNEQNQLQDDYYRFERQENNCQLEEEDELNTDEIDSKNNYGRKLNENDKNARLKKINVVEFQQFTIHNDKIENFNNANIITNSKIAVKQSNLNQNKRDFTIEIPENEQSKRITDFKSDTIDTTSNKIQIKQPPCPSHKSSLNFKNNKHFIFPVHDQESTSFSNRKPQNINESSNNHQNQKKQIKKILISNNTISQQQHNIKVTQIINQSLLKIQQLNKKFQKQRQQFYKQKSNLEKDLMIRDGQIQMLQKLITNRYEHKDEKTKNNQLKINQISQQQQIYTPPQTNLMKNSIKISQTQKINQNDKLKTLQNILLEKDLKITQLLQKINQLHKALEQIDNELESSKISLIKQHKITESLKNQLFLLERKRSNQKLTKQFYKIKQIYQNTQAQAQWIISQNSSIIPESSSKTPKLYSKQKNEIDDFIAHSKSKEKIFQRKIQNTLDRSVGQHYHQHLNQSHQMRGIDDLHRRLQSLKMNRIELQNRGKIKSQVQTYSQTTKYKPKGSFDFKGKYYQQIKTSPNNINISRNY